MGKGSEVVAVLASPPGEGGVAVVEVVGPGAVAAVARKFSGRMPKPGSLAVGRLVDEVVVSVVPARRSPLGEPTVEVSCHGGLRPAEAVIAEIGVRRVDRSVVLDRAVAARRLDRPRAEAMALLPEALTVLAAKVLQAQAQGALSRRARRSLMGLLATAPSGLALVRPPLVAIVGRANVGKSTLFNALVERERALVSPVAGTTRDPVEETVAVAEVPLRLVDTAGLLGIAEVGLIEQLSIERTRQEIRRADALLVVRDATAPDVVEEELFLNRVVDRPRVVAWNKVDLTQGFRARGILVSGRDGTGVDRLRRALLRALGLHRPRVGEAVVFTDRQRTLLEAFEAGASETIIRQKLLWG
jgi:tRNA modification GTPase